MKPEDQAAFEAWRRSGGFTRPVDAGEEDAWHGALKYERDAQPAVAVNEQMLDVLKFIQRGMERNHIKAKPFLDFSNPNAESLELQHPLTLVNAAIAAAEKARGRG